MYATLKMCLNHLLNFYIIIANILQIMWHVHFILLSWLFYLALTYETVQDVMVFY